MSDDPPVEDAKPELKECRVCAKPMPMRGLKCTECGSYQGWFANLGLSSTILSLLVALVTVTTAFIPAWVKFRTPLNSNLVASYQTATPKVIYVLVSNSGIRPGSVWGAAVEFEASAVSGVKTMTTLKFTDSGPVIINPGESKLLTLTDPDRTLQVNAYDYAQGLKSCDVFLQTTDFLGAFSSIAAPFDCGYLNQLISGKP